MPTPVYRRVLLKLSGEALKNEASSILDFSYMDTVVEQIKYCVDSGVQVAIVIGAGNIWRGARGTDVNRTRADHMGMLATVINSLALADALEQLGAPVRVQTGIEMIKIAEPYIRNKAVRHMEKGRIVIFGCGTGNPFFSTDTGAALRAAEIDAEIVFKATNVDGVYDKDPNVYPDAKKYDTVSHDEVLRLNLKVMDATAAALCRDNHTKILVFSMKDPENIVRIAKGEELGTIVE